MLTPLRDKLTLSCPELAPQGTKIQYKVKHAHCQLSQSVNQRQVDLLTRAVEIWMLE